MQQFLQLQIILIITTTVLSNLSLKNNNKREITPGNGFIGLNALNILNSFDGSNGEERGRIRSRNSISCLFTCKFNIVVPVSIF